MIRARKDLILNSVGDMARDAIKEAHARGVDEYPKCNTFSLDVSRDVITELYYKIYNIYNLNDNRIFSLTDLDSDDCVFKRKEDFISEVTGGFSYDILSTSLDAFLAMNKILCSYRYLIHKAYGGWNALVGNIRMRVWRFTYEDGDSSKTWRQRYEEAYELAKQYWYQDVNIDITAQKKIYGSLEISYNHEEIEARCWGYYYTNPFWEQYYYVYLTFPYRIESTLDTTVYFGGNITGKNIDKYGDIYVNKASEYSQFYDTDRTYGTLLERTGGIIKLDAGIDKDLYKYSDVLFPEPEDALGFYTYPLYKCDMAERIVAKGGTVPGYNPQQTS